MSALNGIFSLLIQLYTLAIIIRVIMSWTDLGANSSFGEMLFSITEPFLAPLRKYTLAGDIDLSPVAALVILAIVRAFLRGILTG